MEPTIGSEDRIFGEEQVAPDYKEVICFTESLKRKLGLTINIRLNMATRQAASVICSITSSQRPESNVSYLAPTIMLTLLGQRIKTDKSDAHLIAQCLCYGGYHPVYIPIGEDDTVKEYLRMRDEMNYQACHLTEETGTRSDIWGNPERIYGVL